MPNQFFQKILSPTKKELNLSNMHGFATSSLSITTRGVPSPHSLWSTYFRRFSNTTCVSQKSIESGQLDHHSASFCALIPKNTLPRSIYKKSKNSLFRHPQYEFSIRNFRKSTFPKINGIHFQNNFQTVFQNVKTNHTVVYSFASIQVIPKKIKPQNRPKYVDHRTSRFY